MSYRVAQERWEREGNEENRGGVARGVLWGVGDAAARVAVVEGVRV